jgi:hypothetical protein
MSDSIIPKLYIHTSKGRIVETRSDRPTEPPQWGAGDAEWEIYRHNNEMVAAEKTITELRNSLALHMRIIDQLLDKLENTLLTSDII